MPPVTKQPRNQPGISSATATSVKKGPRSTSKKVPSAISAKRNPSKHGPLVTSTKGNLTQHNPSAATVSEHGDEPDANPKDEASVVYTSEEQSDILDLKWRHFVQRVRIHEMLKCMRSHHERLKVLREHTDLDDMLQVKQKTDEKILQAQIESRALRRRKKREEEEAKRQEAHVHHHHHHHHHHEVPITATEQELQEEEIAEKHRQEADKLQTDVLYKGVDNLFLRTQEEEEEAITQIYPPLKQVLTDPKYIVKCALAMFRARSDITEEEFNAIIELCQDEMEKQALKDAYEETKNREKYLHNADERRRMLYDFINSKFFVQFMLVTIIVSIIGISLLTFERISITYAYPLIVLDNCIIGIFVVEATFKITIYKEDYFKKPWNLLDILIIVVNFVEVAVELITKTLALSTDINAYIYFKILRSLRALRLLRIIKFLPNLQVVVTTIFQSMLSLGSIAVLMMLFILVFAVLGRGLFSEDSPNYFGGIVTSFVTLFQLLTLDDWFELMQDLPYSHVNPQYWMMFFYLFFYIIIENLIFLNLFVAVLVDNFQITLAETEVRKHKEALVYSEENDEFRAVFADMERFLHERKHGHGMGHDKDSEFVDLRKPELTVPDYFPVSESSREKVLLEHVFKDLCAIDFQRFLWKRRLHILHTVMDKAIVSHKNTWAIQDNDNETELARLKREQYVVTAD